MHFTQSSHIVELDQHGGVAVDLFLVARPTGRLLSLAAEAQEKLNQRYKIYSGVMPPLHLTLARLQLSQNTDHKQALGRLDEVVRNSPPFRMQVHGYVRFGPPHLAVCAAVVGDETLFRIRADLVARLDEQLFVYVNDYWKPHITLVSTTYGRAWSEDEWKAAFNDVGSFPLQADCCVEELELWYPHFEPTVRVVARFRLGFGLVELLEANF